jgi:hypothetical protein
MWILGIVLIASIVALMSVLRFDTARLALFGPTAKIYLLAIRNGLIWSIGILLLALAFFSIFKKQAGNIGANLKNFYSSLSTAKQNILVLALCFAFVFLSNPGNIIYGYFNMDDFEIVGLNHSLPFSKSVLMPHGNDHAFPLFITEMKVLDVLFGQNPAPYNFFFFMTFSLIPFFVYLVFKKLGLGMLSFITFLIIFSGAPAWTEIASGFYIMSVYPQILLFFSVASWGYLSWKESKSKKDMAIFALGLILALASDTSGIWVIPAIILFMIGVYNFRKDNPILVKQT